MSKSYFSFFYYTAVWYSISQPGVHGSSESRRKNLWESKKQQLSVPYIVKMLASFGSCLFIYYYWRDRSCLLTVKWVHGQWKSWEPLGNLFRIFFVKIWQKKKKKRKKKKSVWSVFLVISCRVFYSFLHRFPVFHFVHDLKTFSPTPVQKCRFYSWSAHFNSSEEVPD